MVHLRYALLLVLAGAAVGVSAQPAALEYERAFPALPALEAPLGLVFANDGSDRVYSVELAGRVRVFENRPDVDTAYVFLDLRDKVGTGQMYSVAFHPDYAANGYLYVYYVAPDPDRSVLARYTRSEDDPLSADPASEVVLLEVEQPSLLDHNGGVLAFGPEGYLYLSFGDGGVHLDAPGNAQNRANLLGSVIRIDVDHTQDGRSYAIPLDNPYVGTDQGWREEIWAHGFRNPWRGSFDRVTGDLWIGDVGELTWEEIDRVEAGLNYGWNVMEGPECLGGGPCNTEGLTLPLYAYGRDVGGSITGGYVYRGRAIPSLYGWFVFGDFNAARVWAYDPETGAVADLFDAFPVSSFGEDREGELYLVNLFHGQFFRIKAVEEPTPTVPGLEDEAVGLAVVPNPFRERATVNVISRDGGPVQVTLYDLLGREVRRVFDGELPPNQLRRFSFGSEGLPAGVYLVRVQGAFGTHTQRVTLLQ